MPGLIQNSTAISTELGLGTNAAKLAERAFKHQPAAELKVRSRIGEDAYEALVAGAETVNKANARKAEAFFCLYFVLPILNLRMSEMGGLSKVIGMDSESTEELMGHFELEKVRGTLVQLADQLLDAQIPAMEDGDEIVTAGSFSFISVKGEEGTLW